MKRKIFGITLLLVMVLFVLTSCVTATSVPRNATPEQLAEINALNLEATATNTSTLAGIQLASLIAGFIAGFMSAY